MPRSRWRRRQLSVPGARLSVRDTSGQAPAVVLLTGLGTSQRSWDRVAGALRGCHRVITVDYRGHGRSSAASSYTFPALLDDLHAVLQDTAADTPLLCGWSLGADLAVWYAAEHPGATCGVIVVDGALPTGPVSSDEAMLRQALNAPLNRLLGRVAAILGAGVQLSTDELLALIHDVERRRTDIASAYQRLDVPVTVALASRVTRSEDAEHSRACSVAAEQLASACPGIRITWLDSDHAIPLRRPHQLAHLIARAAPPP